VSFTPKVITTDKFIAAARRDQESIDQANELMEKIINLVYDYKGMPFHLAIGAIRLAEMQLINEAQKN
jgi:hypothetical protein